ncbi:MAG: hypothetical protein ABIJ65_03600 [Chloroflexota bacterium]
MKSLIKVEVPLSEDRSTPEEFTIDPPCFYCGEEVDRSTDHIWKHGVAFPIKYWNIQRLDDVRDEKGNTKFSSCHLKIPFCSKHIKPEKTFQIIDIAWMVASLLVGIIIFIGLIIDGGVPGWLLIGGPLAALFFTLILFGAIGQWFKSLIIKSKPGLQDYSKNEGHYGIEVGGVRTEGGVIGVGPIRYTLLLSFSSAKLAQRFLSKYPQASVTGGKELMG